MRNEKGFITELAAVIGILFFLALFLSMFIVRFKASQSDVSGIVYNTEFNHLLSGKTTFSVRASVDTYIYHDQNGNTNESDFCLPKNSPYTTLIKQAAANKNIKVDVVANKYFTVQAPWTCRNNVVVTQVK